jgi:hypothetical protein
VYFRSELLGSKKKMQLTNPASCVEQTTRREVHATYLYLRGTLKLSPLFNLSIVISKISYAGFQLKLASFPQKTFTLT